MIPRREHMMTRTRLASLATAAAIVLLLLADVAAVRAQPRPAIPWSPQISIVWPHVISAPQQ